MPQVSPHIYQLFLSELQRQLAHAHAELMADAVPSAAEAKELGRTFHTIRGGAGFLGFDAVAEKAAILDQLLRKSNQSLDATIGQVREVLAQLEAVAATLPSLPSEDSSA